MLFQLFHVNQETWGLSSVCTRGFLRFINLDSAPMQQTKLQSCALQASAASKPVPAPKSNLTSLELAPQNNTKTSRKLVQS